MTDMPARPWIRNDVPLIWRSEDCIEIGSPPTHQRLVGVDRAHVAWLLSLRGDADLADALARGDERGIPRGAMRRLIAAATATGLLDDAAAIPESLREAPAHVRDLVDDDLAALRHLHGGTPLARMAMDRRRRAEVAIQGSGPVADALALALASAGVGALLRSDRTHSSSRRHRRAAADRTCHVLCTPTHPDAAADPDAMALDIPHLAITAAGARAVIGPLVVPGRTGCLRCRELHLADADPAWPRAAVQWASRRPPPVAAGLAHLAGAWGALQVLALIDAGVDAARPIALGAAVSITLPEVSVTIEERPAHPLCGCLWPRTGRGVRPRSA